MGHKWLGIVWMCLILVVLRFPAVPRYLDYTLEADN